MEFRPLGPLEVADSGRPVQVGAGRRRSLLALLLLHANEVVRAERLIDELWGEHPPATVAKSLHVSVSQLRKELAGVSARIPFCRPRARAGTVSATAAAGGVWIADGTSRIALVDAAGHDVTTLDTGRPVVGVATGTDAVRFEGRVTPPADLLGRE